MLNELAHGRKGSAVVGRRGDDKSSVPKGVLNAFVNVLARQVKERHFWAALVLKDLRELLRGLARLSVNRSVGHGNVWSFHAIAGPSVVLFDVAAQVLVKDRSVQGADFLNVKGRGFF